VRLCNIIWNILGRFRPAATQKRGCIPCLNLNVFKCICHSLYSSIYQLMATYCWKCLIDFWLLKTVLCTYIYVYLPRYSSRFILSKEIILFNYIKHNDAEITISFISSAWEGFYFSGNSRFNYNSINHQTVIHKCIHTKSQVKFYKIKIIKRHLSWQTRSNLFTAAARITGNLQFRKSRFRTSTCVQLGTRFTCAQVTHKYNHVSH
jgi:hypothetical protein